MFKPHQLGYLNEPLMNVWELDFTPHYHFFWNLSLVIGDCHDESCPNEGHKNRKTPADSKLAK